MQSFVVVALHTSQQFLKCLAEGNNAVSPVSIEHATIQPRVEDSVT